MEKMTPDLLRTYWSRTVSPVIIEARAGAFVKVRAQLKSMVPLEMLQPKFGFLPRLTGQVEIPLSKWKEIPTFNMVATVLIPELIEEVAQWGDVEKIYPDYTKYALQVVPDKGVYKDHKGVPFTSTYWTKRLMGLDRANDKGFAGRDILAIVIDTGARTTHEQLGRVKILTAMAEKGGSGIDSNGHGCIHGDACVYTSFCGVEKFSVLFDKMEGKFGSVPTEIGRSVFPPETYYTLGFQDGRTIRVPILGIHRIPHNGPVVHVAAGQVRFTATPWHLFLVRHPSGSYRYVRADQLRVGMCLVIPNNPASVVDESIDLNIAYLAGLVVGDGHLTSSRKSNLVLISGSKEDMPKIRELLSSSGYKYYQRKDGSLEVYSLWRTMKDLGIPRGKKSHTVRVPKAIFRSNVEAQKTFLAGLFDADGWFHKTGYRVKLVTASKDLAEDVRYLLSTLGIISRIYPQKADMRNRKIRGGVCYHVQITRSNAAKLRALIAPLSHLKKFNVPVTPRWNVVTVTSLYKTEFKGFLYDFTTSSQNYLAGEGGMSFIHNSWCCSCLGGARGFDRRYNVPVEGMAPHCNLTSIQALGFIIGAGSSSDIISAMETCIGMDARVVSMSLGSADAPKDVDNPEAKAIDALAEHGIVPCVAGGNSGPSSKTIGSPGSCLNSLTVAAEDPLTGRIADFSSRGPTAGDGYIKPDVSAPGVRINSALVGFLDNMVDPTQPKYGPISGTSMSTPHAAGLVTCMSQLYKEVLGRRLTVGEVKRMMEQLGPNQPKDNDQGNGFLDWGIVERWVETEYGVRV